jgi:hypothetical protein
MFEKRDLVFSLDPKTGEYRGGGYIFKSELLNAGAPPLIAAAADMGGVGGGGGGGGRGSPRRSNSNSHSHTKVSSMLMKSGDRAIPAGLLLMNMALNAGDAAAYAATAMQSSASFSSTYDDYRARAMGGGGAKGKNHRHRHDGDDDDGDDDDDSDSDDSHASASSSNNNSGSKHRAAVVPVVSDDLYTMLLKMVAPGNVKKYWSSNPVTARNRNHQAQQTQQTQQTMSGTNKRTTVRRRRVKNDGDEKTV